MEGENPHALLSWQKRLVQDALPYRKSRVPLALCESGDQWIETAVEERGEFQDAQSVLWIEGGSHLKLRFTGVGALAVESHLGFHPFRVGGGSVVIGHEK